MLEQDRRMQGFDSQLLLVLFISWITLPIVSIWLGSVAWVLALIVLLILFIVILNRPIVGTCLTAFLVPCGLPVIGSIGIAGTDYTEIFQVPFARVYPAQITALLTACVVGWEIWTGRRRRVRSPCGAPYLVLIGLVILSAVTSNYPLESLRQVLKLLFGLLPIAWITIQTHPDRQGVHFVLLAFLAGIATLALSGLAQVLLYIIYGHKMFADQTWLPNGLAGDSAVYGGWLGLATAIVIPVVWLGFDRSVRLVCNLLFPILLISLLLSANRSGWLATVAVLGLMLLANGFTNWKRSLLLLLLTASITTGAVMFVNAVLPMQSLAITTKFHLESWDRILSSQLALEAWRRHPLLGNGVGTFMPDVVARNLDILPIPSTPRGGPPINLFVGILYDLGLAGLFTLLWIIWRYLRTWWLSRTALSRENNGRTRWFIALAILLNMLIISQFHGIDQNPIGYFVFALGLVLMKP